MNWKMIKYTLGRMLIIEGLLMLLPMIVGLCYQENIFSYIVMIVILCFLGWIMSHHKPPKTKIYAREGFIIVALSWLILSFFGAFPFYLSGEIPSYVDAFFEIVSGFTTTGSSILENIEALSYANLFWRSFSHWIGGMGILVFVVAMLPDSSGSSLHILRAEMPGPTVGKLVSKIKMTAQILYMIYLVLTFVEVILLLLGGLPLFDSLVNAFGTAGTGGFAIKNTSIAFYQSAYVDVVITIFMLLFGINFNVFYFILLKEFRSAWKNSELKAYLAIIVVASLLITWNILSMYPSFFSALRYASFQVVSIITTTGYITADYGQWPMFSQTILFLLMFVGACASSTGGGMKVSRILMVCRYGHSELRKMIHPHSVVSVDMDGRSVSKSTISGVHAYFSLYFILLAISFLLLSLENMDFTSTLSSVVTCINNVGPGFNIVGPTGNFSSLSDVSKLVLCFDMLAGRLELFPFMVLFLRDIRH